MESAANRLVIYDLIIHDEGRATSEDPIQSLFLGLFVVVFTVALSLVSINELRRGGGRVESSWLSPLRQLRQYPKYSLTILAVLFIAGVVAVVQGVYYLILGVE
ncbi:hypothetical protein GCM10027280_43080 [Micromonospora polyrhachis]